MTYLDGISNYRVAITPDCALATARSRRRAAKHRHMPRELGDRFTAVLPGYDRRFQRPALPGGDSISDKPTWQVALLDDIERRGTDIPVREHLGIHAFGINASTPSEDGTLISEHDESGSGQEELTFDKLRTNVCPPVRGAVSRFWCIPERWPQAGILRPDHRVVFIPDCLSSDSTLAQASAFVH